MYDSGQNIGKRRKVLEFFQIQLDTYFHKMTGPEVNLIVFSKDFAVPQKHNHTLQVFTENY